MDEKYIVNIANGMRTLKDEILNEEILKAKIIESEREREILNNKLVKEQENNANYKIRFLN